MSTRFQLERTWEAIPTQASQEQQHRDDVLSKYTVPKTTPKRALMRRLCVVVDMSHLVGDRRLLSLPTIINEWLWQYFDKNPVASVAVVGARDGVAWKISGLSGSPAEISQRLANAFGDGACRGELSVYNAVRVAKQLLVSSPTTYTPSLEILLVHAALTSIDPQEPLSLVPELRQANVRVNAVSLFAEWHVLKQLCSKTGGRYAVCLDRQQSVYGDFSDRLTDWIDPPALMSEAQVPLMEFGFPADGRGVCVCHHAAIPRGHSCPRCLAVYCEQTPLPHTCQVCRLTLVSSVHLARSLHFLFPVAGYEALGDDAKSKCFNCTDVGVAQCRRCHSPACVECVQFVMDELHVCPGCV